MLEAIGPNAHEIQSARYQFASALLFLKVPTESQRNYFAVAWRPSSGRRTVRCHFFHSIIRPGQVVLEIPWFGKNELLILCFAERYRLDEAIDDLVMHSWMKPKSNTSLNEGRTFWGSLVGASLGQRVLITVKAIAWIQEHKPGRLAELRGKGAKTAVSLVGCGLRAHYSTRRPLWMEIWPTNYSPPRPMLITTAFLVTTLKTTMQQTRSLPWRFVN
jgi:hypothetical protein